jgi:spore coat polysaccharide biosynthesis predicted glycosyltransferase SpsG
MQRKVVTSFNGETEHHARVQGVSFFGDDCSCQPQLRGNERPVTTPSGTLRRQSPRAKKNATVLFITSNGIGLGHLTRMMAIARRLPPHKQAIFLTMSQGLSLIVREGFFAEYFPAESYLLRCVASPSGRPKSRLSKKVQKKWDARLQERLQEMIAAHDPETIVFDGVWIYDGLYGTALRDFRRPFIWSRRAMWKPELDTLADMSWVFDAIVEPGELAESMDIGRTVAQRQSAIRIPPVVYLEESELLDKDTARRTLGLDAGKAAVLIQLGTGNIGDIQTPIGLFVRALMEIPDIQIVVAEPPISNSPLSVPEGVRKVNLYPLSKYYRAFDFAISASGYNSYHELIAFAVPTIFVPNLKMLSDNQASRARYAEEAGVGLCVEEVTGERVQHCLKIMLDEERRGNMASRCRELSHENGANTAVKVIEDLMQGWADLRETKLRKTRLPARILQLIRSSYIKISRAWANPQRTFSILLEICAGIVPYLKTKDKSLPRALFLTLSLSAPDLEKLLTEVHRVQTMARTFAPVFVTDSDDFHLFRQYGYLFEYVPPERQWNRTGLDGTWTDFSARRIKSAIKAHRPRQVVAVYGIDKPEAIRNSLLHVSHAYGP